MASMLSAEPLHRRVYRSKSSHIQPVFGRHNTGHRDAYKRWDPDTLSRACKAVSDGMSIRRAAEEFNVPRSTLHDHITGKVLAGNKSGSRAYLTHDEEEELVSFLTGSSTLGYSRTVKQVIDIVQRIVDKKGIDVTVSASWWKSFKMRHRDIVLRTPETLTHSRIVGAKSCARVITSNECRKEINEKEEHRVETLRLEEERRAERMKKQEEKKRLQEEKKRLQEEKKRLQEEKKRLQEEKKRLQEEKKNSKTFNHISH